MAKAKVGSLKIAGTEGELEVSERVQVFMDEHYQEVKDKFFRNNAGRTFSSTCVSRNGRGGPVLEIIIQAE